MRLSHDVRQNIAWFNLLSMLSRSVSFMSQLVRNAVLIVSQICCVPKLLRLNCEGLATSSRRVRDTRDDFTTILRGILSHKIFEHVQNFRDCFAPFGDTCEEITNHWRLFRDCFATHSRCLSPAVAKQSQSSEIGAYPLRNDSCFIDHEHTYKRATYHFVWGSELGIMISE